MKENLNNDAYNQFISQSFKEEYKSFSPSLINRLFEWKDKQINILLETTMYRLGELNSYCRLFPHIDQYIPLFIAREVVASNHMEGIKSGIFQAFTPPPTSQDKQWQAWKELRNYMKAIDWAMLELDHFPLSIRLIKQTHRFLFSDLPGEQYQPGKMRDGSPLGNNYGHMKPDIKYIPPNRHELKRLVNDAKKFWRNENLELPQLIKMAITLYQFENILPFLNGNGRTARTLMLLELISLGYLKKPVFCLSVFFERNRLEYYHRLNLIRSRNDIEQWIRFFLNGIRETAEESIQILEQIRKVNQLYLTHIHSCFGKKRHESSQQLLRIFYTKPYLSVKDIAKELDVTYQSANQLVREMEQHGFIREIAGVKRNRIFFLWEYMNIFEN